MRIKILGLCFSLCCLLSGCTFTPKPIPVEERYNQAKKDIASLFKSTPTPNHKLDFTKALALGLKNNLDYRIKRAEIALQSGQLQVAEMIMFPAINLTGSYYTRNNELATFSITPDGQTTSILTATPPTLQTYRTGISWNILDFGISYLKAKQQGNRVMIAEEEARKQAQLLTQDILVAYWRAYSAQELLDDTKNVQKLLNKAKLQVNKALHDKTIPKENILNFQASLLDGNRKLFQLKYKYDKAMLDLKHLISLPLDTDIRLTAPPKDLVRIQKIENVDFKKIDAISLVNRPELLGQDYQVRIAAHGIQQAILQALPGFTFNYGWNYNSNEFLVNQKWIDKSLDLAWNLINLASLPALYNNAKAVEFHERLKLMALTMTVLTETRYAFSHYVTLSKEYAVAHQQTVNAQKLFQLMRERNLASLASTQQVILAKLKYITTKMDEDLLLSDLSTTLGELYLSMGADILPTDLDDKSVDMLASKIKQNLVQTHTMDVNDYVNEQYKKLFNEQKV